MDRSAERARSCTTPIKARGHRRANRPTECSCWHHSRFQSKIQPPPCKLNSAPSLSLSDNGGHAPDGPDGLGKPGSLSHPRPAVADQPSLDPTDADLCWRTKSPAPAGKGASDERALGQDLDPAPEDYDGCLSQRNAVTASA